MCEGRFAIHLFRAAGTSHPIARVFLFENTPYGSLLYEVFSLNTPYGSLFYEVFVWASGRAL